MGFEEAYPLFALSTPDVGGLGWDPLQIGKVRRTWGGCPCVEAKLRSVIASHTKHARTVIRLSPVLPIVRHMYVCSGSCHDWRADDSISAGRVSPYHQGRGHRGVAAPRLPGRRSSYGRCSSHQAAKLELHLFVLGVGHNQHALPVLIRRGE